MKPKILIPVLSLALLACLLGYLLASNRRAQTVPVRDDPALQAIGRWMAQAQPLFTRMRPPQPGDWLLSHEEPGQTFQQYLQCQPVVPRGERSIIYIQPLGNFNQTQRKIIALTADFMGRYFCVPVKIQEEIPLSAIPPEAQRLHPSWGDPQILSTYVLYDLLKPRLPQDAAACIAFTSSDLWPGAGWNFVFGQASLRERVGVWSIYRNGDPDADASGFKLCLLRTLKTATHETGHMFSMLHCTQYECNMCGSNNRGESDRRPILLCPECVAKVWWGTGCDPLERYQKFAEFCREQGLDEEQRLYEAAAAALRGAQNTKQSP